MPRITAISTVSESREANTKVTTVRDRLMRRVLKLDRPRLQVDGVRHAQCPIQHSLRQRRERTRGDSRLPALLADQQCVLGPVEDDDDGREADDPGPLALPGQLIEQRADDGQLRGRLQDYLSTADQGEHGGRAEGLGDGRED